MKKCSPILLTNLNLHTTLRCLLMKMLTIQAGNSLNFKFPIIKLRIQTFNALATIIALISTHHTCYNLLGAYATTVVDLHIHRSLRGVTTTQISSRSLSAKLKNLYDTTSCTSRKPMILKAFKEKE